MDANELLSLKILKDANPDAFQNLAAEETKWLALSLGLLRRDVYLQVMMGGKGVRQAMKLSGLIKNRVEQAHFNHRISGVVERMLTTKFLDDGWSSLKPIDASDISEFLGYDKGKNAVYVQPMSKGVFVYGGKDKDTLQGFRFEDEIPKMEDALDDGLFS